MRLILNEEQFLNDTLNNHYVDTKKPTNTIRILAKYYLGQGMNKSQTYQSIDDFLIKHYKGYNSVNWFKTVNKVINSVRKSKNYRLINIKISISENEINTIKVINNSRLEKLAFVLLVYAKIYNQLNNSDKNWVNEELKYIFSDAKIAATKEEQCKLVHKLIKMKLVRVSNKNENTNIQVMFADKNGKPFIEISDFRNFVYEYLKYLHPEKYDRCSVCGLLMKLNSNRHEYCDKCAKIVLREQWKNASKKYYSHKIENS